MVHRIRTSAVIGVPIDAPVIRRLNWMHLELHPLLCVSAGDIEDLPGVDALVVVLTPTSLCSTRFQAAVLRALAVVPCDVPRWVVNLSGEQIPLGLGDLRDWAAAPAELVGSIEEPAECADCSSSM